MAIVVSDNAIDALETDYLYIQKSEIVHAGDGLFTAITIFKDEIICLFAGEILSEKEIATIVKNKQDQYFISMLDGTIMDCRNTFCFAKYANDANGTINSNKKNNAKIGLDDANNVCLIATKKINIAQEILCGYGKRYWLKHKL